MLADFFSKIDTTIMGRKTAAVTAKMRERKPGKREGFAVVSGSLKTLVRKLKRRPGKDIYLGGGGRSFLQ